MLYMIKFIFSKELAIEEDAPKLCCHQNLSRIVEHEQREYAFECNNNTLS